MTYGRRLFWTSFALLGAVALGISAASASEPSVTHAKPEAGETTEAWVYLGRRSEEGWKPAARSISRPPYPVKPGDKVVIRRDALVYGSVDCKVIDAADFKPDGVSRSVLLVKARKQALEIAAPAIECPSIGRAKTVWASVKIPAARLVSVEK